MFSAKTYQFAQSAEEAYEMLTRHKTSAIVGGCGWLRLGQKRIWTAVDLTRLGLDQIERVGDSLTIGCMVTLRQLETDPLTRALFGGILADSVARIVGVQFRNMATVGGSVWMRAGFSDLLCALSVLDTTVHLHAGGALPLADFIENPHPYTRDLLTHLTIACDGRKAAYKSLRPTATDFPTLTAAVSYGAHGAAVAVGARPGRAMRVPAAEAKLVAGAPLGEEDFSACAFGDNLRGAAVYRQKLAPVLVTRAAAAAKAKEGNT